MNGPLAAALATLPILTILILMLGLRWSAARAGMVGLLVALGIAWQGFGFGTQVYPTVGASGAVTGALLEASFTAVTILWIIFPALCIHHLQTRIGAVDVLRLSLGRLSSDPRIVAILVAWFFALFLEGAAGFGTPIALAAPFLVSAGFGRVEAVTIVLVGHAAGVSFGAVGTPVLPQIAVTGFTGLEIARATGLYHALLGWVMLLFVMLLVRQAPQVENSSGGGIHGWVLLAAVAFLLPFFAISRWVGPELPTLGGALAGGVVFVAILAWVRRRSPIAGTTRGVPANSAALLRAGAPYLILVGLILATRLIEPVEAALRGVVWGWAALEHFGGSVQPLYHPGTALLAGFLLGGFFQRASGRDVRAAAAQAARQLLPVTVALVAMLGLARVMVHSGMVSAMADTAAAALGGSWPLFVPFVGVLGTFITGSATASNILFTDFQQATANALDLPAASLVGAQGFGAAVGNIICPHNIIAGGATVGLSGREGEILRKTIWPCLLYAVLGGGVALVLVV